MKKTIFGRKYGEDLANNLVHYWKFGGNSLDSIGSANGVDKMVSYSDGKINQAVNFTGAWDSFISVPYSQNFDFVNGANDVPFSISFWAKRHSLSEGAIAYRASNSFFSWTIRTEGTLGYGLRLFSQNNSSNLIFCSANAGGLLGTWQHIVFTYDGSKSMTGLKGYVNGVANFTLNTQVSYAGMLSGNIGLAFGRRLEQGASYLNGSIDEFAIWKGRVLKPIEIMQVFNNGIN